MQNTSDFLEQLHERTERVLQKAVGQWQMLAPEQLEAAPKPGAWSAAQCLEHLNIYGRHYLPAIEQAIGTGRKRGSRPEAHVRPGYLGEWFTGLMLPQPDGSLKKKLQAPKNTVPSARPEPRAMLAEFIDQQEKMLALLESAAGVNLNKIKAPTSLSPWIRLRLADTLAFVVAHIERHVLQAERALAAQVFIQPAQRIFTSAEYPM